MFIDSVAEIPSIAVKTGCAVFVLPAKTEFTIKNATILQPEEKSVITIDQVKEIISRFNMKQATDQFIIVRPAESLGEEAANAFLKNLEEPGEKTHFLLITSEPSQLLPTILSRSAVYFLRQTPDFTKIDADEKVKTLAKKLISARPAELPALAEEIAKKKDGVRAYALNILSAAIEMLYKTYFLTEKSVFLEKLPKFLKAYDAISNNGHVKLQLIASLM